MKLSDAKRKVLFKIWVFLGWCAGSFLLNGVLSAVIHGDFFYRYTTEKFWISYIIGCLFIFMFVFFSEKIRKDLLGD